MQPSNEPDTRPARIFRFVDGVTMGALLVEYDKEKNILRINKPLFDQLDKIAQKQVLRTERSIDAVTLVPAQQPTTITTTIGEADETEYSRATLDGALPRR